MDRIKNLTNHKLLSLLLAGMLVMMLGACASSGESVRNGSSVKSLDESATRVNNLSRSVDLTTHLKKLPGVRVRGYASDAVITIRGNEVGSFSSNTSPLFVIDGNTMNCNYKQIYSIVNGTQIKSLKVLKGADAAIYGIRGGNGVIEITTGN